MNEEAKAVARKVAEQHWSYIRTTLGMHNIDPGIINVCEHHYMTAWMHAWKHCIEWLDGQPINDE